MKAASEGETLVVKLLPDADLSVLGKLLNSQAQVAIEKSNLWIRYRSDDEGVGGVASCLNGRHFHLLENHLLVPLGSTVATERLPALEWQKLTNVVYFELPMAGFSGKLAATNLPELSLLRGGPERPASAGLYALAEFACWVETAPQFRLRRLSACVSEQEVLVIGNPLPPIACQFLCQDGRLLTPAGMTWYPRIAADQVLEHFDVGVDQLMLWMQTEKWSSIPMELLKPVQRGSIRAFVGKHVN
ncbi:MAG: hypothetical protein SFV81_05645 [Pirellulaceae bacterium]|nr:hypothetical protein [Pirellulaceae bacterium]